MAKTATADSHENGSSHDTYSTSRYMLMRMMMLESSNDTSLSTVTTISSVEDELQQQQPECESSTISNNCSSALVVKTQTLCSKHISGHIYPKTKHTGSRSSIDHQQSSSYSLRRNAGARDRSGRLIEKEGILLKRRTNSWLSIAGAGWIERHVVLRRDVLEYYALGSTTTGSSNSPRDTFQLCRSSESMQTIVCGNKCCFTLLNDRKIWVFRCPSPQNCASWVRAINGAIETYQTITPPAVTKTTPPPLLARFESPQTDNSTSSIEEEEPVLLTRRRKTGGGWLTSPVTPPMDIYCCDSGGGGSSATGAAGADINNRIPPSPGVGRNSNAGGGVMMPTWPPQPNYKFANIKDRR